MTKTTNILINDVQLILEDEKQKLEAFASVTLNPFIMWAKFVLLDDQANANNQAVPQSEFSNVLRTGTHMPLKMAEGGINQGHEGSSPIGTITHLFKKGSEIIALAALWETERPDDIAYLKEKRDKNESIDISWELAYSEKNIREDGVEELLGVSMNAATIVGNPAYGGRTPIVAMASKQEEEEVSEELEKDVIQEESSNDELAELKIKLEEANKELEDLRAYKQAVESAKAEEEKFASVKQKFNEAGLELDATYFDERREQLVNLDDSMVEFMIQEMIAFASKQKQEKETEQASLQVHKVSNDAEDEISPKDLGKLFRQLKGDNK